MVPGEDGLFAVDIIHKDDVAALYGGRLYPLSAPKQKPTDNTYQILIPGCKVVIDAAHGPAFGNGHKVNECWNPELANVMTTRHSKHSAYIINIYIILFVY